MMEDQAALHVQQPTDEYNATVVKCTFLTPLILILRVRPDHADFSFIPGQYTVLGLKRSASRVPEADPEEKTLEKQDKLIRRAYSIASDTRERDCLEFYLSMVPSGELTPRLFHLQPGDRLFVGDGSKGMFTLDQVPPDKNILLVATGTGLAPYMSMMRSMALEASGLAVAMAVLHGAGYSWDLGYRAELESLAQRFKKFRYLPMILYPQVDRNWTGRSGLLQEWLSRPDFATMCGMPLDPLQTHIFLCGNQTMVESVMKILIPMGYAHGSRRGSGTLHLEKYW